MNISEGTLNSWRARIANLAELMTLQESNGIIIVLRAKQQETIGLMLNDIVSEMDEYNQGCLE